MKNKLKLITSFFLWIITTLSIVFFVQTLQNNQQIQFPITVDIRSMLEKFNFSSNNQYKKFDEIYRILKKWYRSWNMVNSWNMRLSALKSFVSAIGDPFTVYMDAKEEKELKDALKWSSDFEWIWAYISKRDDWIRIEEVIKDSPAYKAWLKMLDTIIQVNWESTLNMSLWEAVKKIRWPKWTKVELTILRKTKDWKREILKKVVTRDKVKILSVKWKMLTWDIWYIAISSVWQTTADLLAKQWKELIKKWMKKLILDLRWNWWWMLDVAEEILSYFIPKWKIIIKAKYRNYPEQDFRSKWYWLFEKMPVVVLVDWMTASAWEIIAMALVELKHAKLVWTRTFGKWTIQTIYPFDDWSALKYTIGKRYSPNWENINWTWFFTWKEIKFDFTWYQKNKIDNQLEYAKKYLLNLKK